MQRDHAPRRARRAVSRRGASGTVPQRLHRQGTGERLMRGRFMFTVLLMLAFGLAATAWASGWAAHNAAGLSPRANAWSATAAALLAWQGFHVAVLALMAHTCWHGSGAGDSFLLSEQRSTTSHCSGSTRWSRVSWRWHSCSGCRVLSALCEPRGMASLWLTHQP
jgi:hypothetical protein